MKPWILKKGRVVHFVCQSPWTGHENALRRFDLLFIAFDAVESGVSTTWLWWSGIGSQTFWRLLAAELVIALKLLGGASRA